MKKISKVLFKRKSHFSQAQRIDISRYQTLMGIRKQHRGPVFKNPKCSEHRTSQPTKMRLQDTRDVSSGLEAENRGNILGEVHSAGRAEEKALEH